DNAWSVVQAVAHGAIVPALLGRLAFAAVGKAVAPFAGLGLGAVDEAGRLGRGGDGNPGRAMAGPGQQAQRQEENASQQASYSQCGHWLPPGGSPPTPACLYPPARSNARRPVRPSGPA